MIERAMPTVTFRCEASGHQKSAVLTLLVRFEGHPDFLQPVPVCDAEGCARYGKKMTPMQYDYGQGAGG